MTQDEIDDHEERLRAAMLASDADALDGLLADDLVFTDHQGRLLTKADDLAAHRSGLLKLQEILVVDRRTRPLSSGWIVAVRVSLAGTYEGIPFTGDFRYTRVWSEAEGRMRVAAAHCSAVA